jgi:hypothetical protein
MDALIRNRNIRGVTKLIIAVSFLAIGHFWSPGEAKAQEEMSPEALAVAYVIETDGLDSLGGRLALDLHRYSGFRHESAVANSLTRLADSVGARVFSLEDVKICPPSPRPVETYRQGCRFTRGIEVVLSAWSAEPIESGLIVWVNKHFFAESTERGSWEVFGHGRQVLLRKGPDGAWSVTGFGPGVMQS